MSPTPSDPIDPSPALSPATLAAQALGRVDESTQAIVGPLHPSTTFQRRPDGSYLDGRGYTRADSPAYDEPEQLLAALEHGKGALLFSSGMAAATSVFCTLVPGDHVIVPRVVYWGLRKWLAEFPAGWGVDVEVVDAVSVDGGPLVDGIAAALRPGQTRLVWLETPANPTWDVTDIAAAAEVAHQAHARLVVDSTVATPVLTRPLDLGADLVMHSATKYLNGHSDVLAGAVVYREDDPFVERLRAWRRESGNVLGPFEAWLLLRGMRTLFVRVGRACESALAIARHFEGHPALSAVLYPGLASHPGHGVAARQMEGGFGAMLSLRVRGDEADAMAVGARLRLIKRATSLGGVETLIEHRRSIEGPSSPVPPDLLRLSVGIEDVNDLIADLSQALAPLAAQRSQAVEAAAAAARPSPLADGVAGVIETSLRPTAIARGGDLRLASVTDGVVSLEMTGSPGAVLPLHAASAAQLGRVVPNLREVAFVVPGPSPAPAAADLPLVDRAQAVLNGEINPAVAAHGGRVAVAGCRDGVLSLRFEARCVGCTLAEVTLRQGVEPVLRARLPEVTAVIDVTDHRSATDPYFRPSKR